MSAHLREQWAKLVVVTAARAAGRAAGAMSWESTRPWTWPPEKFASTPGWELYDSDRPVLASNEGDRIRIYPAFFRSDESVRRGTLYHEAGHDVASSILASGQSVWEPLMAPFQVGSGGGLRGTFSVSSTDSWGQNHEEFLSDVYAFSYLYPGTYLIDYEDPERREAGMKLRALVRQHAQRLGLP